MPAIDLLVRMQATRTHMALVIDEYGGTDGLVSIEDLVEMVVGDIEDEHDERPSVTDRRGRGRHLSSPMPAPASTRSRRALGVDLADEEGAEDIDTIGGFIVTLAGRVPVPQRGDRRARRPRIRGSRCRSAPRQAACASTAARSTAAEACDDQREIGQRSPTRRVRKALPLNEHAWLIASPRLPGGAAG